KIETYDKIFALALSDIDHDGIDEIICASGNNLYIFKDEVFLICQIDYPLSIFAEKELTITFYIKNNTGNRIYNIDFSNLEWVPKILTLKKSTFKIPILESYGGVELTFKFDVPPVEKVTPVVFPRFKIIFEMKNLQLSQNIPEITVNILPPFSRIAQNILKKCEHLINIKVPLKSLAKFVEKDLGPLNHDIEQIISRLLEEGFIEGSLSNWVLFIRDVKPFSEVTFKEEYPSDQKVMPPRLFMNALRKIIKSKKRTLLPELVHQYKYDLQEIQEMIKKLKDNFEITGVLIPDEEFLFLSDKEINQIVETINNTPNISLSEIATRFDLLEKEVEFLINDLIDRGMLYGQIITLDNEKKFITVKTLSELLLNELEKQGKITILTYSRKMGLSADLVREAIRTLLDSNQIQGTYTFNGAIFYTQARLEKDLLDTIKISEISSIGLSSLAKDFMISKDTITAILNNLINKQLINGYISENTLFIKSYEEERLRDIFEKYVDALNLIHILIIHKESGIAIFSGSYTTEKIDPVLVSGFLQAITSFGSEISGDHAPFRLLHYKNFKISVQEGQHILGALILKSDPSQRLLDILKHFIRFFETNYREHLQDFRGGIDPFQDADTLVDDFFEISLSFPHEINEKQVFKNRNKLSANDLVLINLARSLGRQFALGTLIELASKEMLISQLEAFSIIYDLRDKNIFYVPSEERKWCPHCGSIIQKSATTCPHCLRNIHETLD
ncbi:MAG: zinc ribbon domain-containing protein, partial [Candidatus Helarchaeota archaeon]